MIDVWLSYRKPIVEPAGQPQSASLVVKREEWNVYWTGGPKFGRRGPENVASVSHHRQTSHVVVRKVIGTKNNNKKNVKYFAGER